MKYALGDLEVKTAGDDYYIAPSAQVIGNVTLGHNVSIWWNAVLRGDNDPMTIGDGCNVQDGCVLHTDPGYPLTLEKDVSIGHMVMLHGCTIGEGTLIGIGSIILNGAKIGENCLVGAGSLITEGKEFPDNSMILGRPGKVVKEMSQDMLDMIKKPTKSYQNRWPIYKEKLREMD
jgi:carbonic anhydrase/acetyltransferase-like protein (isoleucine patch superfamily)